MKPIEAPDSHRITAAQGWLELGNTTEAAKELDSIAAEFQIHPDALEMRWTVESMRGNWEKCVQVADTLTHSAPGRSSGWVHRSYALHELNRTQEAFEQLLPAMAVFQDIWVIPYNLACYQCQLGSQDTAMDYYTQAFEIGGDSVKDMALRDKDLLPLHKQIESR
ncbi:MAG: hypothetical protein CMO66_00910 [Verrucomicrobiales bacterium]|nr:hypothetical protein [Verrucomicrobiales bacterium]